MKTRFGITSLNNMLEALFSGHRSRNSRLMLVHGAFLICFVAIAG